MAFKLCIVFHIIQPKLKLSHHSLVGQVGSCTENKLGQRYNEQDRVGMDTYPDVKVPVIRNKSPVMPVERSAPRLTSIA
jgi:hypothetical protein